MDTQNTELQATDKWRNLLQQGEGVRHHFGVSRKYIQLQFMILSFVTLPFVILTIISAVLSPSTVAVLFLVVVLYGVSAYRLLYVMKKYYNYILTDRRIIKHVGWFRTQTKTIEYNKITDRTVNQSFLGRIYSNSGNLVINTASSSTNDMVLENVEDPYQVDRILDELVAKAKHQQ